jgi:hypothetical protein
METDAKLGAEPEDLGAARSVGGGKEDEDRPRLHMVQRALREDSPAPRGAAGPLGVRPAGMLLHDEILEKAAGGKFGGADGDDLRPNLCVRAVEICHLRNLLVVRHQ